MRIKYQFLVSISGFVNHSYIYFFKFYNKPDCDAPIHHHFPRSSHVIQMLSSLFQDLVEPLLVLGKAAAGRKDSQVLADKAFRIFRNKLCAIKKVG